MVFRARALFRVKVLKDVTGTMRQKVLSKDWDFGFQEELVIWEI